MNTKQRSKANYRLLVDNYISYAYKFRLEGHSLYGREIVLLFSAYGELKKRV